MEKKCKKAKWLSGEALQIAVKRREVKSKGEKEIYKHMNAKFQRIAFLSDQCKEIEENNRMGKTRDLVKKIRDTKGTFRAKMSWQVDFIHMPPVKRVKFLLVFVDTFSGWTEAFLTTNK